MLGGSNVTAIPYVIQELQRLNPKTIIDIGAGRGKYGMLCREYLKDLEVIDAVEPREVVYNGVYNCVFPKKIQDFNFSEGGYDVALLVATLCNFTQQEGFNILEEIKRHCKHVVLTIEKKQHGGKTQWDPNMFQSKQVIEMPYEWLITI